MQAIPGAAYWEDQNVWNVTCNVASLPNVTFQFNGISCSVPPSLYVQSVSLAVQGSMQMRRFSSLLHSNLYSVASSKGLVFQISWSM